MGDFNKRKNKDMFLYGLQVFKLLNHLGISNNVFRKLKSKIYKTIGSLDVTFIKSDEPIPFAERLNYEYSPITSGELWGKNFDCAWFNMKGNIPESAKGEEVCVIIDIKAEGAIVDDTGSPLKGLARIMGIGEAFNPISGKKTYPITESAKGGEPIDLWVEAGNNLIFTFKLERFNAKFKRADIAILNRPLYDLYFDFLTLIGVLASVSKAEDKEKHTRVRSAIKKAIRAVGDCTDEEIDEAKAILAEELARPNDFGYTYYCTGHGHLDLAWLWPIRESKRKAGRTISNQLYLAELFPEYVFACSQPQMYKWIKDEYPALYERLKIAVHNGNIEPVGGMWVEADSNLPSGESLVRQNLYGKRFFRKEFDKDVKVCFLPDAFGFSGALPQIIEKSGMEYFLTTKMSWNEYSEFPYHSFHWKGIDGSSVLSHFPPSGFYSSEPNAYYVNKTFDNYKNKESYVASLLFGAGDGGGGPSEAQVEIIKRSADLEGVIDLKMDTVHNFFSKLKACTTALPTYNGELYLQKHTGTFTTQAKVKYYNRFIENVLHDVEMLASYAFITYGMEYPHSQLNDIWEEVLLYQFHDIIPGSSIKRVYDECYARYVEMLQELSVLKASILSKLSKGKGISAINTTSFSREEWLKIGENWYKARLEPYSADKVVKSNSEARVSCSNNEISSDLLEVKFGKDGSIVSLIDKTSGNQYVAGFMNKLMVYHDEKLNFNAWDIDAEYIKHSIGSFELLSYKSYVDGKRVIRRQNMKYGNSTLTQDIILTEGVPYVEFDTRVDWHEENKMLRANFVPAIYSDKVTCNIQFGNISRTTKTDTIDGYASYEICAHKWVDVSSYGHGFSLLNNCKYGHRVKDGLLSLNLLRSTVYPDKTADRGEQEFKYAIYPHMGLVHECDITRLGYLFNNPLQVVDYSLNINNFMNIDNRNIIIETVKKAEDYDGLIVRMYESKGYDEKATLTVGIKGLTAYKVNMIEDKFEEIDITNMEFSPYEIKSILLMKKLV